MANGKRGIPQKYPCGGYKRRKQVVWSCITCKNPVMDNNMVPTLFHKIYKKHFGTSHDSTQKSTWHWIMNPNIRNFTAPAYTRNDLLHVCIMMHKGHWSKMFLWMLEEYVHILGWLCEDDRDGLMVLGHELLLLVCSRCCKKRGEGRASCCPAVLSLNHLPACSRDTLECSVHAFKDTIALECLAWVVYDNVWVPGKSLSLSSYESYGQVLQCLLERHSKNCLCIALYVPQPYLNHRGE